jgi:anaphase-promoting complex subunit 1
MDQVISFPNTDRISVSRLIFNQDRRFSEAVHMIEPYRIAVAECIPEPQWTEAQILDAQREVHQWVMTRTFSLAPGLAFAHYDSRVPLLSEKFTIHGYNTLCVMKPLNNTVSVDRTTFTEEQYAWAWFHSGVAAGLSISKNADGIDSSWIVFNRPSELNNRHAGLLLALGLNGHLRSMAKWLSFKYLTPKHTMTSIGLLLGLSASYLGTMDTLVTRLLSVHITRMLPPGAAELNLSPLTQTAGLMGVGLLYYDTQHRRMSEVILSEIENMGSEDTSTGSEPIRDESYRLAGGLALGFINLGKGADLKGLHDLKIVERLLSIAVGPRRVNMVHMIDQATAGATIAIMLIFMKTGNKSIARKIDIPETTAQFDFVRPDILLLRTVAKHLILWDDIRPDHRWIVKSLPKGFTNDFSLRDIESLSSEHMPFYNVLAGLLWSVGLRFAGTGNPKIRDFLIAYLDQFMRICRLPALRYDSRLARNTARNCQDIVALSAATVMAGTGDLDLFRRLRSLHGRVNPDTTYGSHMACHMALGALFFGGGCYSLGTSNLAIASMIAAFYPVFPTDITDNKAHLQAFRHFWVMAAEARCIIPRDMDSNRTISLELAVQLRNGTLERVTAPRLLPSLESIARISTIGPEYWPVVLDFAGNPAHLEAFKRNQTLNVRRRPAHEAHTSVFTGTLLTLNEARSGSKKGDWIFRLPAFRQYEMTDLGPFLDGEEHGCTLDLRGSALDDWLLLSTTASHGWSRDRLWNLKILFKWVERASLDGSSFKWIRKEMLDKWKSIIEERARQLATE